ncbi:YciI family protein [Aliiglaciecola lipolytica]|uniref:Histidine kinase n=1 Tax=Aliiglaciecola lipolytica E3 TaxID=1127673 RepID=K6YZB6_9ALTE|nr:YciI family protein [Aliiglaciecola lipolytica]GAC16555.1 histidine kinase [Aliiglaciecola lipolytica E3]
MKVMVIVKASTDSEAGKMPSSELLEAMGNFNQELVNAGIMESGDGLKPSSQGYRVRFSGKERAVTQGPFAETNELIAGYWIWNVSSMEEALEWAKKCPNPMEVDSDLEIRPFYSMEDFADIEGSADVEAQEKEMQQTISLQQANLNNYLFFSGRCEEALDYYQTHLGARLGMLMRFSDSPEPLPEGMLSPGFENKVMHCEFCVGDSKVLASDGCGEGNTFSGFSLALTVNTSDLAHRIFAALADDGEVNMPLAETFWSPLYGQVTDKFGIAWMIMLPATESH